MWSTAQLLLLAINAVNSQFLINNLIQSTVIPPGETTRKDRMDTIYDEPVGIFTDVKEKLTPQDIEEFFDRDRRRKWSSSKQINPNASWRSSTLEPTTMYKTDASVFKNDPIEMEFQQMPARAKVFQEDSGLQLATTRPIIRPIGTETEITMSMSTLSDQSAPEMAEKNLDLTALSPMPRIMNDEEVTSKPAVTIIHTKKDDSLHQLRLESAVDMAVIPRLHNDVQKLIEEVSLLKQLVSKLLELHAKEKRKEKMGKKRRNSRKVTGTSLVAPPGNRLTATQTQDHASTDHFVHIYKDGQRSRSIVYGQN